MPAGQSQKFLQRHPSLVADVVGLGKSYIDAAILKHFERTDHARGLILCPVPLVEMWERYNEVYQLNARVFSMGMLREDDDGAVNLLLEDVLYKDRDFVLVDESQNLRHRDTQRYKVSPVDQKVVDLVTPGRGLTRRQQREHIRSCAVRPGRATKKVLEAPTTPAWPT